MAGRIEGHTLIEINGKPACTCGKWEYKGAKDIQKAFTQHIYRHPFCNYDWKCFDRSPRVCEYVECRKTYIPNDKDQRFCTKSCFAKQRYYKGLTNIKGGAKTAPCPSTNLHPSLTA